MQKRVFDCKECRECGKICFIPSWVYCSDNCHRVNLNKRQVKRRKKVLDK